MHLYTVSSDGCMSYEDLVAWEVNLHRELSKGIVLERTNIEYRSSDSRGYSGLYKHAHEQLNGIECMCM